MHEVELIHHLFMIPPKAQLFEVPNIHNIIMWAIIWFFPFTLSISPINLTELLVLGWSFYNSKSFFSKLQI